MLVLDSSAALAWALADERESAEAALDLMNIDRALVPTHWILEVSNGLRMAVRRRRLTSDEPAEVLARIRILPLQVDLETPLRGWFEIPLLADTYGLTTYDAAYLELAMRLDVPLATLDQDLARAAREAGVLLFN